MSFELRCFGEHGTGLVAVCDMCGSIIENAEEANLCWLPKSWSEGEIYPFKITCKVGCTHQLDREAGENQFTQELDVAIGYLMNNSRVNYKHMRGKIAMLYRLGLTGEPHPLTSTHQRV